MKVSVESCEEGFLVEIEAEQTNMMVPILHGTKRIFPAYQPVQDFLCELFCGKHLVTTIAHKGIRERKSPMGEIDYRTNLEQMLIVCGDPGRCKACGADIWWMVTRKGNVAPYTKHGFSHFMDCPKADDFRKRKPTKESSEDDLNIDERG